MKKVSVILVSLLILTFIFEPIQTFAQKGDNGYEGGITVGVREDRTPMQYQEVCFITGEPLVLKGTLTINKSKKQDTIITTYNYTLRNDDVGAVLTRNFTYNIQLSDGGNGNNQQIEKVTLGRNFTEVLRLVNGDTYVLTNYDFDFSSLTDTRPAINYYAGTLNARKVYRIGNSDNGRTVTQEITGKVHGYNQYWGSVELASLDYVINWATPTAQWGGTAHINLSNTVTNEFKYVDNIPEEISFKGRYVQFTNYNSTLIYTFSAPELDTEGEPTYRTVEKQGSLKLENQPTQKSLVVPELSYLRGHWLEEEIKRLYSLQIFKENENKIIPENYITRGEFVAAVMEVIKEVPEDPSLKDRTSERRTTSTRMRGRGRGRAVEEEIVSPFVDLPVDHPYFNQINNAYSKSLVSGKGQGKFGTDDNISLEEALVILIRALGLENLAPGPGPNAITPFIDDDQISTYARKAIYIANRIGLITADERGYVYPKKLLSFGDAAVLLDKFINYMCEGLKNDWEKNIKDIYSF